MPAAPDRLRYRLLTEPPVEFELFRQRWQLTLHEVAQSGGTWRCSLLGSSEWSVAHHAGRERLLVQLMDEGIEIGRATFVGTAFRELERRGVAERVG